MSDVQVINQPVIIKVYHDERIGDTVTLLMDIETGEKIGLQGMWTHLVDNDHWDEEAEKEKNLGGVGVSD